MSSEVRVRIMRITATFAVLAVALMNASAAGAANPDAGKKFASEVCVACHGVDGNSASQDYPKLAGQHPDYLAKALRDYQSGARNNAIMKGFAGMLKAEDIDNVAAWYGSQTRTLSTYRSQKSEVSASSNIPGTRQGPAPCHRAARATSFPRGTRAGHATHRAAPLVWRANARTRRECRSADR